MKNYYYKNPSKTSESLIPLEGNIKVEMSKDILSKIKLLCEAISTVEWSGILLYDTEGGIKDPENMKIILKDIIPMDKGTSAYTSYDFTEKTRDGSGYSDKHIEYCEEVEEALTWKIGLIHSHNSMRVFFSATDNDELVENAPLHNYYLSLIVNNDMDFAARVAISAKVDKEVDLDYVALDEEGNPFNMDSIKSDLSYNKTFYYDCDISVEESEALDLGIFGRNLISIMKDKVLPSRDTFQPSVKSWGREDFPVNKSIINPQSTKTPKKIKNDIYLSVNSMVKTTLGGKSAINKSIGSILLSLGKKEKMKLKENFSDDLSIEISSKFEPQNFREALTVAIDILVTYKRSFHFINDIIRDLEDIKKQLKIIQIQ